MPSPTRAGGFPDRDEMIEIYHAVSGVPVDGIDSPPPEDPADFIGPPPPPDLLARTLAAPATPPEGVSSD